MKDINVNVVVEISVDMTLNKAEATELLYFLKSAVTAPVIREPGYRPTNIVRRLADAIELGVQKS